MLSTRVSGKRPLRIIARAHFFRKLNVKPLLHQVGLIVLVNTGYLGATVLSPTSELEVIGTLF